MSNLEQYGQDLINKGSIPLGVDSPESSFRDLAIQFQFKPMTDKKVIRGYSKFSRKFTYQELWKIAQKCNCYYSPLRDSVFLLIVKSFPDEGFCVSVIDVDDYKTFLQFRLDPSIEIL